MPISKAFQNERVDHIGEQNQQKHSQKRPSDHLNRICRKSFFCHTYADAYKEKNVGSQ